MSTTVTGSGVTTTDVTTGTLSASGAISGEGVIDTPYGVVPAYGTADYSTLSWDTTEHALKLSSSTDGSIGIAYPAFRCDVSGEFKLTLHYKASQAETDGLYVRVMEYDSELPSGKTHVSHQASSSAVVVQEDTRQIITWKENQAFPTDWTTSTFTYTPTSTAKFASVVVLKYKSSATDMDLFLKDLLIQPSKSGPTVVKSSEYTYAQLGTYGVDLNHGQSTAPDNVYMIVRLTTANGGYAADDVVYVSDKQDFYYVSFYGNATKMGVRFGNSGKSTLLQQFGPGPSTTASAQIGLNSNYTRYTIVGIWY